MAGLGLQQNLLRLVKFLATKSVIQGCRRNISRRAVLYVPGSDLKKLQKSQTLKVDCLAMDCEDGVAFNKKTEARDTIVKVLNKEPLLNNGPEVGVRINPITSVLGKLDIEAVLSAKYLPSTIYLPKVETSDDLQLFSEHAWRALMKRPEEERQPINLVMLIESAKSIMTLPDLCKSAEQLSTMAPIIPVALILGSDDLLADLGATRTKNAMELLYSRQRIVLVGKAFRLQVIDIVHIDYKDLTSLQKEAEEGARMGFTGKQVIHPTQIPIVQESFMPSKAAIEWAKGLILAFNEHQEKGEGAFTYRGSMIDMPLLRQAQNIIQLANQS